MGKSHGQQGIRQIPDDADLGDIFASEIGDHPGLVANTVLVAIGDADSELEAASAEMRRLFGPRDHTQVVPVRSSRAVHPRQRL